jgi:hypothetical protein
MVTWWLEEDQPYSIEEMVGYFQQLFLFGTLDTLKMDLSQKGRRNLHPLKMVHRPQA